LTIILGDSNEWVDGLIDPRATVAGNGNDTRTMNLVTPGRFVGGSVSLDASSTRGDVGFRQVGGAEITYGVRLTAIEIVYRNNGAAPMEMGAKICLFMRN